MVQKKSNTILNSGATQRVNKGQAYSGRYERFTYHRNQISLQFSNFTALDQISRSARGGRTLEALDFLQDHLRWNDLTGDYIFEEGIKSNFFPKDFRDIIVYFSMNKKKRWLLPEKLCIAMSVHNFMLQTAHFYGIDEKSKGFPTEAWDLMASREFRRHNKPRILPSRLIRDGADGMTSHGSRRFLGNTTEHWKGLVQFGLMDRFSCVDLNVSSRKNSLGGILRGRARDKSDTTSPSVCNRCADRSQDRKESKGRKKKAKHHARGIQRPATWNTETISKKGKEHKESTNNSCDMTGTTFQCCRCFRRFSTFNDNMPRIAENERDYLDIQVTEEPHVDARLLGFSSVIKKYGHLPYNAPRVAICKTKSRPSGRLGIHKGFTYARLKQEISHALAELAQDHQHVVKNSAAVDTYSESSTQPSENIRTKNDMTTPKKYTNITLRDFLVESKPKEARKKRRRAKKSLKSVKTFESTGDPDNFITLTNGRSSIQTFNNLSILYSSHLSPDYLTDWSIIGDVDNNNSFIWIDSDCEENWDGDDF